MTALIKYCIIWLLNYLVLPVHAFHIMSTDSVPGGSRTIFEVSRGLTLCKLATEKDMKSSDVWLSKKRFEAVCKEMNASLEEFSSLHADVTCFNDDNEPSIYRLTKQSSLIQNNVIKRNMTVTPQESYREATEQTLRWCSEFVQKLDLCPWAKLSLQSKNAIRIKIVEQGKAGLQGMEHVIRESASELIQLTDNEIVDMNAGITFVIALPNENSYHLNQFRFENFYGFATDLEDKLFHEADEANEENDGETHDILIGDEITMAPFHPDWFFTSEDDDIQVSGENPLDYEKMSPFPSISLVRTKVIEQAGEEATRRIGSQNEETLHSFGSKKLEKLYNENVLQPSRSSKA